MIAVISCYAESLFVYDHEVGTVRFVLAHIKDSEA